MIYDANDINHPLKRGSSLVNFHNDMKGHIIKPAHFDPWPKKILKCFFVNENFVVATTQNHCLLLYRLLRKNMNEHEEATSDEDDDDGSNIELVQTFRLKNLNIEDKFVRKNENSILLATKFGQIYQLTI